jgi:hypothetical protein
MTLALRLRFAAFPVTWQRSFFPIDEERRRWVFVIFSTNSGEV